MTKTISGDWAESHAPDNECYALDERTLTVLDGFLTRSRHEAQQDLLTWLESLHHRVTSGASVSSLEYLVVLAVLRRDPLIDSPSLLINRGRLADTLVMMRQSLLGRTVDASTVHTRRLPRCFLVRQCREAQAIHSALFRRLDGRVSSVIANLFVGYSPRTYDLPVIALVAAVCVDPLGAQIVLGAGHGYLLGTFVEHFIHKHVGHASPGRLARVEWWLSRFGRAGRVAFRGAAAVAFRHGTIHHSSYARNYVARFAPVPDSADSDRVRQREAKKGRIDAMARARGAKEARDIFVSEYGTSLAHPVQDALLLAPFSAAIACVSSTMARLPGGPLSGGFIAASVASSLLFLGFSHWIHPYLHQSREEALRRAHPWMRAFLRSRYVAHIAQAHYLHHRDASVNQNLAIGANFVLGYRMSSVECVLRLRALSAFY